MFGGFNQQVEYRKCTGKDKTNNFKYDDTTTLNVRYCGSRYEAIVGSAQSVEHLGIYHSPIQLFENDKLDGKRVKYVSESVDIMGQVVFWIVKVV